MTDTNEQTSVGGTATPVGADSGSHTTMYAEGNGSVAEAAIRETQAAEGIGGGGERFAGSGDPASEVTAKGSARGPVTGGETGDGEQAEDGTTATEEGGRAASEDDATAGKAKPGRTPENAAAAERRRAEARAETQKAATEAAVAAAVAKAKVEATIAALEGKNPYTGKPMRDAQDVEVYERQRAIAAAGGDPVNDYADRMAAERREAQAAADTEAERARWFADDAKAFREAHPQADMQAVLADPDFAAFAAGRLGQVPLGELYDSYNALRERITAEAQRKADERAARDVANARAASGSAVGRGNAPVMTRSELMGKPTSEIMKLASENPELYRTIVSGR